jgi:CBS domain-containing protein
MIAKVADLMTSHTITAQPHHTVAHVRSMMEKNNIHAIPIADTNGEVAGIVSSKDLAADLRDNVPISHVMTERVYTIPQYNGAHQAARLMRSHHVNHVVVTHEKKIVGILSSFDLLKLVEEHRFTMKAGAPRSDQGDSGR